MYKSTLGQSHVTLYIYSRETLATEGRSMCTPNARVKYAAIIGRYERMEFDNVRCKSDWLQSV